MAATPLWLKNPPPKLKLDSFKLNLYDFQQSGAIFLAQNKNCLLRDETGLGKTVEALAAYNALNRKNPDVKCIVICPASLIDQWQSEAEKFTNYKFIKYQGPKKVRAKQLQKFIEEFDVSGLIVNYDIVRRDINNFLDLHHKFPFTIFLDEAQKVKNPQSPTAKAIKALSMRASGTKMLTATPIQNQIGELFGSF